MSTGATAGKRRRKKPARTAKAKMRAYRERMRAAGYRQVQIWVPDTRLAWVRREIRRQVLNLSKSAADAEVMDEIEALAGEIDGWT
jgi:Antitoxin MazE-like